MDEVVHKFPGIDRLQYFLWHVGMMVAVTILVTVLGPDNPAMRFVGLAVMIASLVLDVLRLRNIGVSQWFAFIRFLPFGSWVLSIGLQCAQPGWAETRRLDNNGRTILIFELVLIGVFIFMIFWVRMSQPWYI